MLARRVYLMNVPYSATAADLESLVSEFAPVDQVVIPRDKAGLSRGFAFAYLKSAKDVANVIDYVDGRHIQGRQIRAKESLVGGGSSNASSTKPAHLKSEEENLDQAMAYVEHLRRQLKVALISPAQEGEEINPIVA